jgi:hypothetical protein
MEANFSACCSVPEIKAVDPRLYFCLSWGCKSSPKIHTYHGKFLEQEIIRAAKHFCQQFITIDKGHGLVILPALFLWHEVDFGGTGPQLLERLINFLSLEQCAQLERLHFKHGKVVKTQYSDFDWTKMFGAPKSTARETSLPL